MASADVCVCVCVCVQWFRRPGCEGYVVTDTCFPWLVLINGGEVVRVWLEKCREEWHREKSC